jgi:multidrug efflux pump subunit AcrA (membrane-fusion protein)
MVTARSALFFVVLSLGCTRSPAQVPPAAAIEKPKVEAELARTTLSPEAFRSLGIVSEPIHNEPVQEHARVTGWVMARPGCEVTVTAPVAGYVREITAKGKPPVPIPGMRVDQRQPLLSLEPVLTPVEQIQLAALKRGVENELTKAQESITAAESEVKRVEALQRQGLRGQQEVEQAQVRLKHAQADLAAATDKLKLFAAPLEGKTEARLSPIGITAPLSGTVLMVHVSPGQYVPVAAPLVTVADLGELWLRVPMPEHDLPRIDRSGPATVVLHGAAAIEFEAEMITVVPQVDTARHTADLLYKLAPAPRLSRPRKTAAAVAGVIAVLPALAKPPRLAKDQMVSVFVPLDTHRSDTVIPYDAVVFDAYGGTWIYIDHTPAKPVEHVFERRRVELGASVDGGVVVRPPLKAGDRVVVTGAAALFSREFHKPPVRSP